MLFHLLVAAYVAVLGLIVGSYLNVVVYRLPRGISTVWPRSRCTACGAAIRARDNLPVVSYLLLRGRCRSCGAANLLPKVAGPARSRPQSATAARSLSL